MIQRQFSQHLARRLIGLELLGDAGELLLIAVQVSQADGQQLRERCVDHLVVTEFVREYLRAEPEIPVRAAQQLLEPVLVIAQCGDDGIIGGGELLLQPGIIGLGEGQRQIVLEKADIARQLLKRDRSEDPRRVAQVFARELQRRRHLSLSRDQRPQPLVRRGEVALRQQVSAGGDAGRIDVRIFLQRADLLIG